MVSWRRTATFVAALTLALTACGGGGGSGTAGGSKSTASGNGSTVQPNTEAGLRDAGVAFATALFAGDTKAGYRFLSKDCQEKTSPSKYADKVLRGATLVEGLTKLKYKDLKVQKVETRNVAGNSGEARPFVVTNEGKNVPLFETSSWDKWLYEDGGWRFTGCKDVGSSSSGS